MDLIQIALPAAEPITIAEAKAHLRVDGTAEDAQIADFIIAARQHVEAATGRALLPQDWELWLDAFPARVSRHGGHVVHYSGGPVYGYGTTHSRNAEIEIPHAPLISVASVVTVAADGSQTTLATSAYQVVSPSGPMSQRGRILPAAGSYWPTTVCGVAGAVRIQYRAGYGSISAVPQPLKAAMLLLIGEMYESREATVETRGTTNRILAENPALARLLAPYKLLNV